MTEAYIFDAVRTPRGKGKKDGSLHQATPVWLLRTLLQALQQRNRLDTALVDDVILGCVTPVGEQGADIARTAVLDAGWAESVAGVTLSRFCASGLEAVNMATAKIASGMEDMVVAGGVEIDEPLGDGQRRRRLDHGPAHQQRAGLRAAGHQRRPDRHAGRLRPRRPRRLRRRARTSAPRKPRPRAASSRSIVAGAGHQRHDAARPRRDHPPRHLDRIAVQAQPVVRDDGCDGLRRHRAATSTRRSRKSTTCTTPAIPPASSTAPRCCCWAARRPARKAGLKPRARVRMCAVIGSEPTIMLTGPTPGLPQGAGQAGMTPADIDLWEINEAFATVPMKTARDLGVVAGAGQRQRRRDRDGPSAGRHRRHHPRHRARRAGAHAARPPRWPRCASAPAWASPPSSNAFREDHDMTQANTLTFEIDANGIGLVTFDQPGRAMNVLNADADAEPFAAHRRAAGAGRRPSRAWSSPRARPTSSSAPTSTSSTQIQSAERGLRAGRRPEGAAAPAGDHAASRWWRRSTAPRSAAAWSWRWPATPASRSTTPSSSSACPRSSWACCRAAAARSACRA